MHKFTSSHKEVIEAIPIEDRAEGIQKIDLDKEAMPTERALGIQWCIEKDSFQFRIVLKDRPCTRRGILSTVSSIYDPLGFVAPLLLEGKKILQDLCREKADWDDPVPENIKARWERWRAELPSLEELSIPRCYKPSNFGRSASAELHHFSDASTQGYGQCSYLRLTNKKGYIHCSFVIGKARVAPLKPVTVPRLELTAAVVSVKTSPSLQLELDYEGVEEVFWTDSKVVLGYIANETRRFHIFVGNSKFKSTPPQTSGIMSTPSQTRLIMPLEVLPLKNFRNQVGLLDQPSCGKIRPVGPCTLQVKPKKLSSCLKMILKSRKGLP